MEALKIVRGNDFYLIVPIRQVAFVKDATGKEVRVEDTIDLNECSNLSVKLVPADCCKKHSLTYSIRPEDASSLRVEIHDKYLMYGWYGLEVTGIYDERNIRAYEKKVFKIVESNEESNVNGNTYRGETGYQIDFMWFLETASSGGGGGGGGVPADEEDITQEKGVLQFKDKEYDDTDYSGLGRVYLRKNIVNGTNVLTQDMINKPNTIYRIQYDYDIAEEIIIERAESNSLIGSDYYGYVPIEVEANTTYRALDDCIFIDVQRNMLLGDVIIADMYPEQKYSIAKLISGPSEVPEVSYRVEGRHSISVPEGCVLLFEGGSINNGTLILNDTIIHPDYNTLAAGNNLTIAGSPAVGTFKYDKVFKVPFWWDGTQWTDANGPTPAPPPTPPVTSGTVYYGFAPAGLVGVEGLNSVEKETLEGTYVSQNDVEGNQYYMIFPAGMMLESIIDTMNFPMALQGVVSMGGITYKRYMSAGADLGYKTGEYEFHCNIEIND